MTLKIDNPRSALDALRIGLEFYDFEKSNSEWQKHLLDLVGRWFSMTHGAMVYRFQIHSEGVDFSDSDVFVKDMPEAWKALPTVFNQLQSPARQIHTHSLCAATEKDLPPEVWKMKPPGIEGGIALIVNAPNASQVDGFNFFVPSALPGKLHARLRERVEFLAAHISSAMRLRRHLQSDITDRASLVFESDGKLTHASEQIAKSFSRSNIDDLAEWAGKKSQSFDSNNENDAVDALHAWTALLDGRWSLLRHRDSDGRRYLLVVENPPEIVGPRSLTSTEKAAVVHAALGHANKAIAYNLGIHPSGVSRALNSACAKLGLRDRIEIASVLGTLAKRAGQDDSDFGKNS